MDVIETLLKTRHGIFDAFCFDDGRLQPPVAFALGEYRQRPPLLRIQSECLPGLVFGSLTCDCAGQRDDSLSLIEADGAGILIHLWQEGRGIGLADKMRAYAKQINEGADTVDANLMIGRRIDERTYEDVAMILQHLAIPSVRLLTNNPAKVAALHDLSVDVESVIPIPPRVNGLNRRYIDSPRRVRRQDSLEGSVSWDVPASIRASFVSAPSAWSPSCGPTIRASTRR